MYAPGHIGLALLAFVPASYLLGRDGHTGRVARWLPMLVLCGLLPDIDLYLASVGHRTITHTPVTAVLAAGFLGTGGLAVRRVTGRIDRSIAREGAVVGLLGVGSHLAGDVVTPMGLAPALPLSATRVTLDLVAARNPTVNTALLAAGLFATATVYTVGRGQRSWRGRWPVRRSRSAARPNGTRDR